MTKRSAQRHRQELREREGEKRLAAMEVKALDAVGEIVERKVGQDESRQPRFTSPAGTFSSVYRWALTCMANEPSARAPFKVWDEWYRDFSKREPFLVGVLNSATAIDKNRGWTLTGGKNQVTKYTKRLHSLDNGAGWRSYIDWQAQSYYTTRMGFVSELGRDGRAGPLLTMWSVDPCRCELSGNPDKPLWYTPRSGGKQEWGPDMFVRGKSLVSTDEAQVDYGYPAIARCYDLAKIMVGIFSHYQQKVGTRTPDGILTGKFIGEEQWDKALQARTEALQADPNAYLNSLATIMSSGGDMPEFALTLLSSIPDKWDFDQWTLVLMRGYALSFGYQSSEFYPEPAGVMGRGKEQEEQRRSATGKGGKDFALAYQEQMQQPGILPPTLEFAFEERDVTGEQADAALNLAKAQVITEITKWAVNGQSVLPVERILELAAEQGVIPEDWTPTQEDITQTDEETADTESERVYRACQTFPDEPIVRYSWPSNKTRTLYKYGADRFAPKFVVRFNPHHEPAGSPEGGQFAEGPTGKGESTGKYDKYYQAAEDFEKILEDAGFHPVLVGSVSGNLGHEPKDIDFVVPRSGYESALLYSALWEYRREETLVWRNYLVSADEAEILRDNPVVRIGDAYYDKVEIWVHEFQPIYKGIHIDLFKDFPEPTIDLGQSRFNPHHEPAGSPEGGQFAEGPGGGIDLVDKQAAENFMSNKLTGRGASWMRPIVMQLWSHNPKFLPSFDAIELKEYAASHTKDELVKYVEQKAK